jgi:hypothetical protein
MITTNSILCSWTKLKPLREYAPSEFRLKKGIEYLEVRQYDSDKKYKINKKKYRIRFPIYRKPLNQISPKLTRYFRKIPPNISKETNIKKLSICATGECKMTIGNGFYINDKGRMGYMNEIKDVVGFLDKIDTPAELQFVLWINNKENGSYYKNRKGGYEVIIDYVNNIANFGKCGKFRDRAIISYSGEITSYKTLQHDPNYVSCIRY